MIVIYKKIWSLFNVHEKKRALQLLFLMILMAFMEVLGVGSIMPFLAVLGTPEVIETNKYLNAVFIFFNFQNKNNFLLFLGGFALFMLFTSAVVRSITSYAKFRFSNLRRHSLGQRLLKSYLHRPYSFFLSRNSSEISKIVLSETDLAIGQAVLPLLNFFTYFFLSIALIVFLVLVDFILAGILACLFGGFYIVMYLTIRKYLTKIGQKRDHANTKRFKIVSETIGGIKDLKILGRERVYLNSFQKPSYEFSHYQSINQTLGDIPQFLVEVLAFGALLIIALYALVNNESNIGELLPILGLYSLGALKLKPSVQNLYRSLSTMKFGVSAVNNILNDLNYTNNNINIYNDNKRLELNKELRIENLEFYYANNATPTLKNINLVIKANTTVGIIGTTGAGKSTLIDILLSLLNPTSGKILIDNNELTQNLVRKWQNSIGYVPQSIFLSDDTIAANIAFGIEKQFINIQQVKNAAKMAQVDSFINNLTQGYDTMIGENGVRLSGGQRQRLGIARALYHDPSLLVLDEATSALDNQTEAQVMEAINNMSGRKTIIMIAHRMTTVEKCDLVIKLDNGQIIT